MLCKHYLVVLPPLPQHLQPWQTHCWADANWVAVVATPMLHDRLRAVKGKKTEFNRLACFKKRRQVGRWHRQEETTVFQQKNLRDAGGGGCGPRKTAVKKKKKINEKHKPISFLFLRAGGDGLSSESGGGGRGCYCHKGC